MRNILIAAATAIAALTAQVQAQPISVEVEMWMLETEEGTERVYEMLERRANRACRSSLPGSRIQTLDRACAADLMDQFVTGIDHTRLTALHTGDDAVRLAAAQ